MRPSLPVVTLLMIWAGPIHAHGLLGRGAERPGESLPPGALARLGSTQFRHGCKIAAIAFSPDGSLLASASGEDGGRDNSVRLWAVATGAERLRFGNGTLRCYCLAFSPDGKLLAAGAVDGTVRLWEVATGREVRRFSQQQGWVLSVAFSPDGKLLAAGSHRDPAVRVWAVSSGTERHRLGGHEGEVTAVAFSPDGKALATGGPSMDARLWEVATGKELRRFGGLHVPKARALAFSPDGALLITAEGDMLLYDVATGRPRGHLGGKHTDLAGYTVAFAPDGKTLAAADWSGNVRIWDVPGDRELRRFEVPRGIGPCLAYSPDGKRLAWGGYGNTIRLWDPASGKEVTGAGGAQGQVGFVAFGLNGAAAIAGSWHDEAIRIWDLSAEGVAPHGRHGTALPFHGHACAVSPNGKMLAVGDWRGKLRLVDLASGEEVNRFPVPPAGGTFMAFTPDGKGMILMSTNYTLALCDRIRGQEIRRFVGHHSPVDAVAISPDGTRMASSGTPRAMMRRPPPGFQEDTATRLWDLTTGKELRQLPGRYATLAFSADGATLAAGAYASFEPIQLLDVATGKVTRRIDCPGHGPYQVVFSPDGKALASAGRDGTVRLWEVATGGERRRFVGHTGDVYSVAFSPDGRRLLSGGADTAAILWNAVGPDPGRGAPSEPALGDLEAADAATAYRAICALLAEPARTVRLLDRTARAAQPADPQRLAQMVADLNSERFALRQQASAELASLAELAEPALQQYLDRKPGLEGRRRAERLLDPLRAGTAPEQLRRLRTVEALESIGSADARRILERLAGGAPGARLTGEAKAALGRLALRTVKHWSPPAPVLPAGIDDLLRGPTKAGAGRAGDRLPAGAVTRLGKQVARPGESRPDFFVLAADARSAAVLDGTPIIRVVDLPRGRVLHSVTTGLPAGWVNWAILSPDGTRLAAETSGGQDPSPSLYLWDVAADKKVWQVGSRAMQIETLRFSPSGEVLATGGRDHVLRLWDAATGKEIRSWPVPNDRGMCLAFSPDGKVLASGGLEIRLWEVGTGQLIRRLAGDQNQGGAIPVAFSPTAPILVSHNNGRLLLWDWTSGRQLLEMDDHLLSGASVAAVSADGRSLLTGSWNGQVRLWELATGKERAHFTGHTLDRSVTGVALTPDGRSAVSAGVDGALFVWDLTGQAPDGQLAPVALSQAERAGLWQLLAGDDAHTAYRAGWKLAAGGDDTVTFLRRYLRPIPRRVGPHLDRLLADLGSDREPGRQAAMAELDRLGPLAASALRKGLSAQPVGETRDRIEYLSDKADAAFPSGEHLRLLRAIEVLERIGSPAAGNVLAELAGGLPEARLTREADQSLRRLDRGKATSP